MLEPDPLLWWPLLKHHPSEQEVNNARHAQNMGIAKVIWNKK